MLVIGNFFSSSDKSVSRKSAGHDFLAFYTAGTFVRTGRTAEMYDLDAVRAFQRDLAQREGLELPPAVLGPFWNPPFFAWPFAPLSLLPYHSAWAAWFFINLSALACAIALLIRMLPKDWRTRGLVPLLILTSPPFIQAVGHGQNTCISLLLLAAAVTCWRADKTILAGVVTGLLFYKPQLGAILALALILSTGWKPLAGLALTGAMLLATTLLTLPNTLSDYLTRLPDNIAFMQVDHRYMWDRHVTLKAFWRLLIQGYDIGDLTPLTRTLYIASVAALASFLFVTLFKLRHDRQLRDRLIAATIVAMPLLMPFYFDYDLLLLSTAAVLVAKETVDRRIVLTWCALFIVAAFNSMIAAATHVNISVVLLTALAGLLIKAARRNEMMSVEEMFEPAQLRQAA